MSKELDALESAREIYRWICKRAPKDFDPDLNIYKDILEKGRFGACFYNIFNVFEGEVEYSSPEVLEVWGYEPREVNLQRYLEHVHEDDLPHLIHFEKKGSEFYSKLPSHRILNYKCTYDYRLRRRDGEYIRIFHQAQPLQSDENGAVMRTLAVFTDMTHLKKGLSMSLSMIGLNNEPSFMDIVTVPNPGSKNSPLTNREREILAYLAENKSSSEIARELSISEATVVNHRKNILRKTGVSNTLALVMMARDKGWI
jgi:DNA-binding CsgD family transcriptional regulator